MPIFWTRRRSSWHDPKRGWRSIPAGIRTQRVGIMALSGREKKIFQRILKQNPEFTLIWLMSGVRAVPKDFLLEVHSMTDATDLEKAAMASALAPLGEYVGSIGMQRPLADYKKEEVLTLIEVVITAYQDHMANADSDEIPF
ncbi:MAG: hypothetical protein HQL72_02550 [Magnetococcales bacterium]|nr:hypothetical protein [Magnetococcales bacterium]